MAHAHLSSPKLSSPKAQSRMTKRGLLAILAAAATTVLAAIGAVNSALPAVSNVGEAVLKTLNIPACLSYADVYAGTQSSFRKQGQIWREYPRNSAAFSYEFKEIRRTRDEILLLNATPRPDVPDAASLVVHLPVCGGTAVLTEGLPERSTNLEQVWPDSRSA
ncbi:hypothetical protein [Bradyrhizobium sp. SZCCHNRI1003]|uniref:hypothetical protein n=1 Tax=Bradyrhizobium sp. SZCCHNRI1003 TaxID=3057275 RepID=UPI002916B681|nr:hypothetical protein [Bradyrhizobium sp. SZCCHNRI1003]